MFHEVMVNILERNGKIEIFSRVKVIKKKQTEMLELKNIEYEDLNKTINPLDIIDMYRNFQVTTTKSTLLLSAHGTFTKMDHILDSRANIKKLKN